MENKKLKDEIIKIKNRILDVVQNNKKLTEMDTRQGLINPLFDALGWDFGNFNLVKAEFRNKDYNEPVDYAFFSEKSTEKPALLLEAKKLGSDLSSPKTVKQLCSYLGGMGVQWGVLSDGNKYIMYNFSSGISFEEKRFLTLQIKNIDTEDGLSLDEFAEKLSALLSKGCLENQEIQKTYETHMINIQIQSAFDSFLSAPFNTLASAIKKEFNEERVKVNTGLHVSKKYILNFLENLSDEEGRIQIDLESQELNSDENLIKVVTESQEVGSFSDESFIKNIKSKRISISDLVKENFVSEGDNWRLKYKGEIFWGRITGNGEIELNGEIYNNPSKAGKPLMKGSCNGWYWWQYKDKSGQWSGIENLRKSYREQHGIKAIKRNRPK